MPKILPSASLSCLWRILGRSIIFGPFGFFLFLSPLSSSSQLPLFVSPAYGMSVLMAIGIGGGVSAPRQHNGTYLTTQMACVIFGACPLISSPLLSISRLMITIFCNSVLLLSSLLYFADRVEQQGQTLHLRHGAKCGSALRDKIRI